LGLSEDKVSRSSTENDEGCALDAVWACAKQTVRHENTGMTKYLSINNFGHHIFIIGLRSFTGIPDRECEI